MTAYPTRTTAGRLARFALHCTGILLATAAGAGQATESTEVQALQQLGVNIERALDEAAVGGVVDPARIATFEQALSRTERAAAGSVLTEKRVAIERALAALRDTEANPAGATRERSQARGDAQILSARHGARCESALGLVEKTPVAVTLSDAGSGGSDAWFRFNPAGGARHYRLRTHSVGPDPKIEVLASCQATETVAAQDDDFGLDAALVVSSRGPQPLFVHLSNSAAAGVVRLEAEDAGGGITGTVVDAASSKPVSGITVVAYTSYGAYLTTSTTDSSGNYAFNLGDGDYYVRTDDDRYLAVLYAAVICPFPGYFFSLSGCDTNHAQLIHIAGAVVSGVDIAVPLGRRVEGTVRDSYGQPLNAGITLYNVAGAQVASLGSDTYGRYVFTPLPPGTYKASAQSSGHGSQMYNGLDCTGSLRDQCAIASATIIDAQSGDVAGINFMLPKLATINGQVHRGNDPSGYFSVFVIDGNGSQVIADYYQTGDTYSIGPLGTGTYYVYASAAGNFSQIYNGLDCGASCNSKIAQATAITITGPNQNATADFDLTALPTVQGHVEDAVSGLPLAGVLVGASQNPPATWYAFATATTDASGNYAMQVPAGTYYVWAQSADHIDALYPNIDCEQFGFVYFGAICDVSGAGLLTVVPNLLPPAFDFALKQSASIGGHALVNAGPDSDLPAYASMALYDATGTLVASTSADSIGAYRFQDLPAGTYFVTAGSGGYAQLLPQLWQHIDCIDPCTPTTGTPIPVAASTKLDGIDFVLVPQHAIAGRVTNLAGEGIGEALVDLFDAATGIHQSAAVSDAQGYYVAAGGNPASYFVATDTGGGYLDQVFSNIQCPHGSAYFGLCPFTGAKPVQAGFLNSQPVLVNFQLRPADTVFYGGFEAD
jgi:Carboxypeptidase regulatory-like domain